AQPGLASAASGGAEPANDLLDLSSRHGLAKDAVDVFLFAGRTPRLTVAVLHTTQVLLAAGMAKLHDKSAVVFVNPPAHLAPKGDLVIVVDHGEVRQDSSGQVNGNVRGNDRADAAAGELQLPIDASMGAGAVVIVETARNTGSENTILHPQPAGKRQLTEDRFKRHARDLVIRVQKCVKPGSL